MAGGPRRVALAVAAFIVAYCIFLAVFGSGAAAGSDTSGYLNAARLLASGRVSTPLREAHGLPAGLLAPRELAPLGFKLGVEPGTLVPTYPIGLSLHLVPVAWLGGWESAGIIINVLAAGAALALIFLLGLRLGVPASWAASCVVLFAVFPVTVRSFMIVMSDGLATTWCLAAIYLALRAGEGRRWALFAGFSFGMAVLVRPTDALVIGAVLLALPWRAVALAGFGAGVAPAGVVWALFNQAAYGGVVATGYNTNAERMAFEYFVPRIRHFAWWISRFLTPVPLLLWPLSVWRAIRGDRRHLILLAWVAPVVGFYAFYRNSIDSWQFLRFLLPALPGLLLAAVLGTWDLYRARFVSWRRPVRLAAGAGLALMVLAGLGLSGWWEWRDRPTQVRRSLALVSKSVAEAQRRVGSDGTVVCRLYSGAVYFESPMAVIRYDNLGARSVSALRDAVAKGGARLLALVADSEVKGLREVLPGDWEEVWRLEHARILELRQAPGAP